MLTHYKQNIFKNKKIAISFLLLPALIYLLIFACISLNINYVAFDDIVILGIIPQINEASTWYEGWKALISLFPEHRLVFSRGIVLLLYTLFGHLNLIWLMSIGNICWMLCILFFFHAFKTLQLKLWYFVPIAWLWFNIQSNENIFWGVSSLCNFGVLFFVIGSIYITVFRPDLFVVSIILAVFATYTYGNGMLVFPVLLCIHLLRSSYRRLGVTALVFFVITILYFSDFKPITQNLDLTNWVHVREGFLGFFAFFGSIVTLKSSGFSYTTMLISSAVGIIITLLYLLISRSEIVSSLQSVFRKKVALNNVFLFSLGIFLFVIITALALVYKRIPSDGFEGMFKGRYSMYSTLILVSLYFLFLQANIRWKSKIFRVVLPLSIILNVVITHQNFAVAVEGRRTAIAQEFNARYNRDWHGLRMFEMEQSHYEEIRSFYNSEDPLAENKQLFESFSSDSNLDNTPFRIDSMLVVNNQLFIQMDIQGFVVQKDFSDGVYLILKSDQHLYAAPSHQNPVPIKTTIRRLKYFSPKMSGNFHASTVEPGEYEFQILARLNGINKIYKTARKVIRDDTGLISVVN